MSIMTVTGTAFKIEANKFGFYQVSIKDDEGNWHNVGLGQKQAPNSFAKGDRISIEYDADNYNNAVKGSLKVLPKAEGGSGGYQKKGGYSGGGKKPFVDNTIGMGVGAALNNAVALYIAGKVKEEQIPEVVANLYTLSEEIKAQATAGTLMENVGDIEFLLVAMDDEPAPKKAAASKPTAGKRTAPAKKAAPKAAEPEGDDHEFDDD